MPPLPRSLVLPCLVLGLLTLGPAPAGAQQKIASELIASGFSRPVQATAPLGDKRRVFVVEQQTGLVRVVADRLVLSTPFLDLSGLIDISESERGLLGMAFHPDFDQNGHVFVQYTRFPGGDTVLERYSVDPQNPNRADPSSGVVILGPIAQPSGLHNGGALAFAPDGTLLVGMGDGGGHQNVGNAQDPQSLLGKVLRLDVDLPAPHVPPDNPFVGDPTVRDEIFVLGVRNPWRIDVDPATGDLYVSDVGGPKNREEVHFLSGAGPGGANFGWPCKEGTVCGLFGLCSCTDPGFTEPIQVYNHSLGECAIIGGVVYRGSAIPDLRGSYFYADFCTGRIWSFRHDGSLSLPPAELVDRTLELDPPSSNINNPTALGRDGLGEILIVDIDGEIFRVLPVGEVGTTYCTGKVTSLGCVPFVHAIGLPSATATEPFNVRAFDAMPGQSAILLYGLKKAALPFHGGTLCVKSGGARLLPPRLAKSGGTPPCSGVLRRNFNSRIQSGRDPLLTVGQRVNAQWLQRDPADPSGWGDGFSDAVSFTIGP